MDEIQALREKYGVIPQTTEKSDVQSRLSELDSAWGIKKLNPLQQKLEERKKTISEIEQRQISDEQKLPETLLQSAGNVVGGAFDIASELPIIKQGLELFGKGIQKLSETAPIKKAGETIEPATSKILNWYENLSPREKENVNAVGNLVALLPVGKGTQLATEKTAPIIGELAGKAATRLETGLSKQISDETWDIIKPSLSIKEKAKALEGGRGIVTQKILPRKLEKVSIVPTSKETEMINVTKDVIKKSNNSIDNISALQESSLAIGQKIRSGLSDSKAIWNKNELISVLKKIEKPITVKSDVTINNQAENFNKAVIQLAENADKKSAGILDVRQEFDSLVNKEFPNLYDKEMTPMRQYISKMRESLNQFAESKLPEGKLPDGTSMREEMRKQHLMLDAKENIAEKTASIVDTSTVKRAMQALRQNPLVAGVTGGILTYGALVGMFTNPLVIGTLVLGGTYKIGKTIITSKIFKESLINVLRFLEKEGKSFDAKAIQDVLSQIPDQLKEI